MFSDGCFQSAFRVNCKRADVFSYYPPLAREDSTFKYQCPIKNRNHSCTHAGERRGGAATSDELFLIIIRTKQF